MFAAAKSLCMPVSETDCHATCRIPAVTSSLGSSGYYWPKQCKNAKHLNFKVRGNICSRDV